jgi:hypothetical protein
LRLGKAGIDLVADLRRDVGDIAGDDGVAEQQDFALSRVAGDREVERFQVGTGLRRNLIGRGAAAASAWT